MYAVNFYLVDQVFGGREEGGWYFTYGEPILHPLNRVFLTLKKAKRHQTKCLEVERELNEGLPSIHSVLSQGQLGFTSARKMSYPLHSQRSDHITNKTHLNASPWGHEDALCIVKLWRLTPCL